MEPMRQRVRSVLGAEWGVGGLNVSVDRYIFYITFYYIQ